MKLFSKLFILILSGVLTVLSIGCSTSSSVVSPSSFRFGTWTNFGFKKGETAWKEQLKIFSEAGLTDLFCGGSPEQLAQLVQWAKPYGITIHAWVWTLNHPGNKEAQKHPEWYSVNREGVNSLENHPYVDYYHWLSPFHPEVRELIRNQARKYAKISGLGSFHLDYVRFCDVFLGPNLQPKYDLSQDSVIPEFDFGYHPIARQQYKKIFGKDPLELRKPGLRPEWRQFRMNAVTSLVNEIVELCHKENCKVSAAVFPFPELARQFVLQDWSRWNLDIACPMTYHRDQDMNVNWIGFAIEQGMQEVKGRFPLFPGILTGHFGGHLDDFKNAILLVHEKGARGVNFFDAKSLKPEYLAVIKELNEKFNP